MELLVDARQTLLGSLIDYAGLFPPARLDLEAAVAEYRSQRAGANAWMLGRFLCPTSRIEELAGLLTGTMVAGEPPWSVGAIFDEPVATAALHAAVFDRHMDPAARVTAVEVRAPATAADGREVDAAADIIRPVATGASSVGPEARVFLELVRTPAWPTGVASAAGAVAALRKEMLYGFGAKLRTGGVDSAAFPTSAEVAQFVLACRAEGIPFKATAGLHHPVRHHDATLGVMRHGFLNIMVASALATGGASEADLIVAIEDEDRAAFGAGPAGLKWRGRRFSVATLRTVRHEMFSGYGSCSFAEPVTDLLAMGILER